MPKSKKRNRDTHPLLERMGVTEIPPALRRLGVTAESLDQMSVSDLREIVRKVQTLSSRLRDAGPSNDDELHKWVIDNIGVDIPRTRVCPDHNAPFEFLADLYFERTSAALALANRGGAKTFIVAVLHFINSTYKPGCESLTFGATEQQGNRCYGHIEDWCYEKDEETGRRTEIVKSFILGKPLKAHTKWRTGAMVEVVAGSENAVSGPHPAKAHADELDLMERGVWNQSRGMAVTNRATGPLPPWMSRFNGMIPPQDIATSTRNSTKGLMQETLDEIAEDVKNGDIAQFDLYQWCIWETVQQVPNCRNAPQAEREAALEALGRDPCELCDCNRAVKGRKPDGSKRTLQDVCGVAGVAAKGHEYKGFRARGWKPYIDLIRTFKRNTPGTWLLQHECRHGRDENAYIEDWSLSSYGIRNYEPHPLYGPIYQGVDWGTGHPASVLWFQYLTSEVPGIDFEYQPIWLQPGIYVLFKEIYVAGIDSATLAKRVLKVENAYQRKFAGWEVKGRFCDPAGSGDKIIFKNAGLDKQGWPIKTRNKERMIEIVQNLVIDDRLVVDVEAAPMFCEEIEVWQKRADNGKELDKNNHSMAAWRYCIANAEILESRRNRQLRESSNEGAASDAQKVVTASGRTFYTNPDEDQTTYAPGFAAQGGSAVKIPKHFTLNSR